MKHVFVFDPKAFNNQQWMMDNILDGIGQFFRTQEAPDWSIQISRYRRNAISIINEEMEKARPGDVVRIYAIGGEEILFDCLNAVALFPNMELAPVPYGESNDFLSIFGKDKIELFRDIPALIKSETLPTDAIRWGINYALNSCYIGMNSAISIRLKAISSSMSKGLLMFFSRLSSYLSLFLTSFDKQVAARKFVISIDGMDYSGNYSLIHVANSPYFSGIKVSDATPDDGILNVALIKAAHPLKTLWSLRRYSRGKKTRNCIFVQAKQVSVESSTPMWIQLDNEYIQDTSINLSCIRHAVQMVALNDLSYPIASISAV